MRLLFFEPRLEGVQDRDGVPLPGVAPSVAFKFRLIELCFECVQPGDVRDRFVSTPGIGLDRLPPVTASVSHAGDFDHLAGRIHLVVTAEGVGLKVTFEAFQES